MITNSSSAVRFCEAMGMKAEELGISFSQEILVAFVIGMVFAWVFMKVVR